MKKLIIFLMVIAFLIATWISSQSRPKDDWSALGFTFSETNGSAAKEACDRHPHIPHIYIPGVGCFMKYPAEEGWPKSWFWYKYHVWNGM